MEYNATKYYNGTKNIQDACELLKEVDKASKADDWTSFGSDFEYIIDLHAILSDICLAYEECKGIYSTIETARANISKLDSSFQTEYILAEKNDYSQMSVTEQMSYDVQKQFDELYEILDKRKDSLTVEEQKVYDFLKEQQELKTLYDALSVLYAKKAENSDFMHPMIENDIDKRIKVLEQKLGIYQNKWYEDIGQAVMQVGTEWKEGVSAVINGDGLSEIGDAIKKTGATTLIAYESAEAGVAKIGEWLVDAETAVKGTTKAFYTWLLHDTWSSNNLADDVMDSWLDKVRVDQVGEKRKNFYENTDLGKWINENSKLKYDSAGAKVIGTATRVAAEIVLAAGAEVCTFGGATPLVTAMFAAEGIGEATESYAQSVNRENGESYNYAQAVLSEVLGGAGGAMKGRMYGKIGGNTIRLLKEPILIKQSFDTMKATGIKNIIKKDITSGAFKVDAGMTLAQKTYEGYVEYKNTGTVNYGRKVIGFLEELLYSRVTDNMMENDFSNFYKTFKTGNASDPEALKYVFNIYYERAAKGDIDSQKTLKKLLQIKEQFPDFHFETVDDISKWCFNKKAVCFTPDMYRAGIETVGKHELGHVFLDMLAGREFSTSHMWDEIVNTAQNYSTYKSNGALQINGNMFNDIGKYYYNEAIKKLPNKEDYIKIKVKEYSKLNNDTYLKKLLKESMDYDDELTEIFYNKYTLENFAEIEYDNDVLNMKRNLIDKEVGSIPALSDITSAVYGDSRVDLSGNEFKLTYHHDSNYYSKPGNRAHEIYANFSQLKQSGDESSLLLLKNTFGEEFYNFLDYVYNSIMD